MKLFISYSRDDSHFVYALAQELRRNPRYEVWIDLQIPGGQDWWDTILDAVEWCDCCIFVMSQRSVGSIYCEAEIGYVLDWHKPILPLLLKTCDIPRRLNENRVQYIDITKMYQPREVYTEVAAALVEVQQSIRDGDYDPPTQKPNRPPVPKSQTTADPTDPFDLYNLAEDKFEQGEVAEAERLFQKLKEVDPDGFGLKADGRLAELRRQREQITAYLKVTEANANGKRERARILAEVYVQKFGRDYDPNGLLAVILPKQEEPPPPVEVQETKSPPKPKPPIPPPVLKLLPPPFEWIKIPKGEVTLLEGGYVPKGGKTYPVEAFAIAKYPITNAQFEKFIKADGYKNPNWWTPDGWQIREKESWTEPRLWQNGPWNTSDHPVVGVSWYEAVAFCLWLSETTGDKILLPTDQQWQRAAQGDDGRAYPWGKEWDGSRCNNRVTPHDSNSTTPVTQYEGRDKGDSFFGVVDMSGNVWEWCLTGYETGRNGLDGTDVRVLRGGSWNDD